jgi:heme exporter protein B
MPKVSRWAQYKALLGKDFTMEFRTKEMLTSMGIYGVLVLLVFGAALAFTAAGFDVSQMASGLLWVLIIFTSLLGLNRSFSHEKEDGALEGLLLVPMDRSLIFLAKTTSNLILLLLVEIIVVPLFFFFFLSSTTVASTAIWIIVPIVIGSIGVAGIGTLLSTITINTRSRDVLLAIMFIPVIFPLLYACVNATSAAFLGFPTGWYGFASALALAAGYDAIMTIASWALYDFVISA